MKLKGSHNGIRTLEMNRYIIRPNHLWGIILLYIVYGCGVPQPAISPQETGRFYSYAGLPETRSYPNSLTILYNEGFVAGYDEVRGTPAWVAYRLFSVDEYRTWPRPGRFLTDGRTTNRINHDHYTHSGYDRGHMAPNFAIATRYGEQAQRETFLMTNIAPQTPRLNRQWWARLEQLVAREYAEFFQEVWVIVGPVYMENNTWIREAVQVPSHYFKIIKVEVDGELWMKAFLVPQDLAKGEAPEPYLTTVKEIESLTGLNFNPDLQTALADSLENIRLTRLWDLQPADLALSTSACLDGICMELAGMEAAEE